MDYVGEYFLIGVLCQPRMYAEYNTVEKSNRLVADGLSVS